MVWLSALLYWKKKKKQPQKTEHCLTWNSLELTFWTFCIFGQQENWPFRSWKKEGNLVMSVGGSISRWWGKELRRRYGEAGTVWSPTLWRRAGEESLKGPCVKDALNLEYKLLHITDYFCTFLILSDQYSDWG